MSPTISESSVQRYFGFSSERSIHFVHKKKILALPLERIAHSDRIIPIRRGGQHGHRRLDQFLDTFDAEHTVRKTHAAYLELETSQPMIDFVAMWLLKNLPKDQRTTLVHSDFRNGKCTFEK